MNEFDETGGAPEFDAVVSRLRAERAKPDPLRMDQIKLDAMRRARKPKVRSGFMKSRLATVFTLLALVGGSGGALAVAGSSGHESSHGAAGAEYRPGKGCGDKNHEHTGSRGNDKPCPSHDKHQDHDNDGD